MENSTKFSEAVRPGVAKMFLSLSGDPVDYSLAIARAVSKHFSELSGYETFTGYAAIFAMSDLLGDDAVRMTYEEIVKLAGKEYKKLTELELVLNWFCWFWYDAGKREGDETLNELSCIYSDLFYECRDLFYKKFGENKEAVSYHFDWTD